MECEEPAVRVLVVEDHEKVRGFLQRGLTEHGYAVDVASDGDAGFAEIGRASCRERVSECV